MSEAFERIITKDGSPTLRLLGLEAMHNIEGAISESEFIYAQPFREAQKEGAQSLMVIGLGLAAIEMLSMANPPSRMVSFEAEVSLREACLGWLKGGTSGELVEAYQMMAVSAAKILDIDQKTIRERLATMHQEGAWQIRGALDESSLPNERFDFIAFDAYSEASSPELWSEGFLANLLDECTSEQAWLTTYAAKGVLKRALKGAGFEVSKREGFARKRESTLARR